MKRMTIGCKKTVCFVMVLLMAISIMPFGYITSRAQDPHTVTPKIGNTTTGEVTDDDPITLQPYNGDGFPASGDYYLTSDLNVASRGTTINGTLNLDLNGHTVTFSNGNNSALIVNNGATLNIYDSNGSGKINVGNNTAPQSNSNRHGGFVRIVGGTFNMYGGTINGGTVCNDSAYGGIVCISKTENSYFNMYDGVLTGSTGAGHGGAVQVADQEASVSQRQKSIFRMYGGQISGNNASWGAGIGIYGEVYIYNGTITNNSASSGGGGIELESGGKLYLKGGVINHNRITALNGEMYKGGGIHVPSGSECHISGNVKVTDNYEGASGTVVNNVFVRKEATGKVILDAALIQGAKFGLGTNANTTSGFQVTTNYNSNHGETDPNTYFSSDKDGVIVKYMNSEVYLITNTEPVLGNDNYPYGSSMSSSNVTLNAVIQSGKATSWQWQRSNSSSETAPDDGDFSDIAGASGADTKNAGDVIKYSNVTPDDGYWYRLVLNGSVKSKPIQLIKSTSSNSSDKFGRTWTRPYSGNPWYISNGTMAYTTPNNYIFDVAGYYVKNNTKYMLQTSYGAQGWKMYSSTSGEPSPSSSGSSYASSSLQHVYYSFDDSDKYMLNIEAGLDSSAKSFGFGCDTQLGNSATSNRYADYAALSADKKDDGTLRHIAMIGAASLEDAAETDPAFVISPITTDNLRFWIGYWSSRQTFAFNNAYNTGTIKIPSGNTSTEYPDVTLSMGNADSGMTMSWLNLSDSNVKFRFSVGDAKSTGAVRGNVNYSSEKITGLNPSTQYTVTDNETGQTYELTTDSEGNLPISGDNYDFFGKNITIAKGEDTPQNMLIAARPTAEAVNANGNGSVASRPIEVNDSEVDVAARSITVDVNDNEGNLNKLNQEYALFDTQGNMVSDGYITPDANGKVTFNGLAPDTEYVIKSRVPATPLAPASLPVETNVRTASDMSVTSPTSANTDYNGNPHAYPVTVTGGNNPVVSYSTEYEGAYSDTVPTFTEGGKHTVYYRVTDDSSGAPIYGSYEVIINPSVCFDANGGEGSNLDSRIVTYGSKIGNLPMVTNGGKEFAGWYTSKSYTTEWKTDTPVTNNITLYARWVQQLHGITGGVNAITVQLFKGNKATSELIHVTNNTFSFEGIPDGEYNLVIKLDNDKTITRLVSVHNDTVNLGDINVPTNNISSLVNVDPSAPDVVVGGLDTEAKDNSSSYWGELFTELGMRVELALNVIGLSDLTGISSTDKSHLTADEESIYTNQTAIKSTAGDKKLSFLNMQVESTTIKKDEEHEEIALPPTKIAETNTVMEIVVPFDTTEKHDITVYRSVGGVAETLTPINDRPTSGYVDGQYYVQENTAENTGYIVIYTKKSAVYGIGYTSPVAKIGDVTYTSLQDAINAASQAPGGTTPTITLLDDVKGDTTVGVPCKFILDRNGHTTGNIIGDDTNKVTVDPSTNTYSILPLPALDVAPQAVEGLKSGSGSKALITPGSATNGTLRYAITTDNQPPSDDKYTYNNSSLPSASSPGTYYVWYKVVGDEGYADTEPQCIQVTVEKGSGSSGGGGSVKPTPTPTPSEDYTIPVENKGSVNVAAKITNGIAAVSDVSKETIEQATKHDEANPQNNKDSITIDISSANQKVTGIDIKTESMENLAEAIKDNDDINSVEIKLTNASVKLDEKAAASIASQADGNTIRLVVDNKKSSSLNQYQRASISSFSYVSPFEAYFESNGVRISNFDGGKATVSIKHNIPRGKDARYFHLYYLAESGDLSRYTTYYEGGMFYFETEHFSDYAIVYDETMRNDTLPEGFTRNSDGTLTFTDPDLGTAIIAEEVVREGTIYRMYNPNTGEHAYTKNIAEVNQNVADGWNHESDADFPTYGYDKEGSQCVYRVYNPVTGLHHYTMNRDEAVMLVKGHKFSFEGIVFFALTGDASEGSQIYRLYNPYDSQHLFTISGGENDVRGSEGWQKEGIAFNVK